MKKIKLFALAAFAMLSLNAMAQQKATDTYTYTVAGTDATITGFVNGLTAAQMETVSIPATIAGEGEVTYNVVAIGGTTDATPFAGNTNIKKVVVEANSNLTTIIGSTGEIGDTSPAYVAGAFKGCTSLTEIDLTNATKLATIGDEAFAGTSIVTLDLSTTIVDNLFKFCDVEQAANADPAIKALASNITLTTLILNDTWTVIPADAFKNCTALKNVNFQTANPAWIRFGSASQTLNAGAFVGSAIEDLDLSGTILTAIPEGVFNVCTTSTTTPPVKTYSENKALKTVKLNGSLGAGKSITQLNGNFSNCPNLTSIDIENDAQLTVLVAKEFQFDAKLTSINLKNLTALGASAFEGTGLTTVTIPAAITAIPANCFQDCAALATVTFSHIASSTFTKINSMAFAGDTKLTDITIPACITVTTANAIDEKAFFMCTGLKTVTFKPAATTVSVKLVHADAFKQCNDDAEANKIVIYTTAAVKGNYAANKSDWPVCATFSTDAAPAGTVTGLDWTVTKYAKADKYYVKVYVPSGSAIKVKAAAGTKVYSAYLDQAAATAATGDPLTMHMCEYKILGGYYKIKAEDAALIITNNKDLTYEVGTAGETTSWTTTAWNGDGTPAAGSNVLQYLTSATSATSIAADATNGKIIYGWVNAESVGTGWMNITSGTMPKGGLYVLAKKPAAGGRLNVVWEDADGNIVEEEATAIQTVKAAKAENGAIYNLAGQKVNAAYKGVVIKDGKKYIQK